jgi:hypothetical protein
MVSCFTEFCPVCVLRGALRPAFGSSHGSLRKATSPATLTWLPRRFENYELAKGENGKPVELGRGAMGITYKAFDVDLHCPVTLKVISERYLGDESARLRFLREARAAASLRHPNVASVFHLGRIGQNYFYAMEFVAGETLENLIKRSGRLEVKLALEIATQVAGGLAAVHKQSLVHRDIKPSNIMVSLEGEGCCHRKNHRPRAGQGGQSTRFSNHNFNSWGFCRDTRVRQSRAICWSRRGHPFRSLLAGGGSLGHADRPRGIQGFPSRGDVSASARAVVSPSGVRPGSESADRDPSRGALEQLEGVLVSVFFIGVGFAFNAPAWTSIVTQVVSDAELPSPATLSGLQLNISGIIGPALGGLLVPLAGATSVLLKMPPAFSWLFSQRSNANNQLCRLNFRPRAFSSLSGRLSTTFVMRVAFRSCWPAISCLPFSFQ